MERVLPRNLRKQWEDPKNLIQIFLGPRQVGKTTAAIALANKESTIFFSADAPAPPHVAVITEHWLRARQIPSSTRTLVLDEIQKIPGWSEIVKRLWDEDQREDTPLRVAILGSSALLIEKGLSESLTGRFETNYFPHWIYPEVTQIARVDVETYMRFGGYPKVYDFWDDEPRARAYIENSIIEPTLGRDILALHAVDKPALLRQLFWYVSRLPAHIVSFEKILGHLQDRGNSATLVHYARLLELAFLVVPLFKFSKASHRTKRSVPKWILPNPALVDPALHNKENFGFVFENLIGAHLLNICYGEKSCEVSYWREHDREIDFVISRHNQPMIAIEVKSGRARNRPTLLAMQAAGLSCPLVVVTQDNVASFLSTTNIVEAIEWAHTQHG